jgi:hypothetical protein
MEQLRFWIEGVALRLAELRLRLEERRRAFGIVMAAGAGIAALALLGSTAASPLLAGHSQIPTTSTQAVATHKSHGSPSEQHPAPGSANASGAPSATATPASVPSLGTQYTRSNSGKHRQRSGSPPGGRTFAPPSGHILHGVSDTSHIADFEHFRHQVDAHPAVLEDFYHWDTPLTTGALQRWHRTHTRGVLSLSTAPGGGPELITPRQIARGLDDHYLLRLRQSIATSHQVVYIRLFPEMNGYWNPYSAFNKDGSPRDSDHSPKSFRRAWQRVALIVRGGKRSAINDALRKRGMPRILRAPSNHASVYDAQQVGRRLARPKVAFMWTPLAIGSPDVRGNRSSAYWPGKAFVDWVGTDLYAKYDSGSMRAAVTSLYRRHNLPFAIGEYSPWNKDPKGHYTRHIFHWAESHRRVGMLIYYRSVTTRTHFAVGHWPAAERVIRNQLNKREFGR